MTARQLAPWIVGGGLWIAFAFFSAGRPGYLMIQEEALERKHGTDRLVTVCRYAVWHGQEFTIPLSSFPEGRCPVVLR